MKTMTMPLSPPARRGRHSGTIARSESRVQADRFQHVLFSHKADNRPRWKPGLRLHHLFEQRCEQLQHAGNAGQLAVDGAEGQWTYAQLDQRANQLARYLLNQGYGAGDLLGLLFDKSVHSYIALLATLKINAAYVPLDPVFPGERIAFIAGDARVRAVLTLSRYTHLAAFSGQKVIGVETLATELDQFDDRRLSQQETGIPLSELCYIIYTSGSTGQPKGVPIDQASICNFVNVAADTYGYQTTDRVYQGLTLAFDFAVEEIWVPWVVGATLVPNQTGSSLLADELAEFLRAQRISALCCVPTLLATLDQTLSALRLLIVSGEACPQDLMERWVNQGCRMLNAYGPTETTVTATLAEAVAGQPVTIGRPLPTYAVLILAPGTHTVLPFGEEGEIVIGGMGVAKGYLNRPEQTAKAFIPDFLRLPNNASGLLYRSGDLGVINAQGAIEYRGRIDLQVKIRGYRIELTEIESALLQLPAIAQAVVTCFEPTPGVKELVAYYTLHERAAVSESELSSHLQKQLPDYMVPAFYQPLDVMPMLASDKADRKALPTPQGRRMNGSDQNLQLPETATEKVLAAGLSRLLGLDAVSVQANFFADLGVSSLLMARYSACIRGQLGNTGLCMRDIYTYPTIAALAAHLDGQTTNSVHPDKAERKACRTGNLDYFMCGALQLLFYIALNAAVVGGGLLLVPWIVATDSLVDVYLHTLAALAGLFLVASSVPIAAKWLLIGRWRAEAIPVWSLRYYRFWLVKQLLVLSPLNLLRGYPLYNVYLRLLGAKIGSNVVLAGKHVPVATDLLSIGDNTILRDDSVLLSYKARDYTIFTAPVHIGSHVVVGEGSTVDINSRMEDNSQLAHASSLQEGQVIPAGQAWQGAPAQPCTSDFRFPVSRVLSRWRKTVYSLVQLLLPIGVITPVSAGIVYVLVNQYGLPVHAPMTLLWGVDILLDAVIAFVGIFILGLLVVTLLPRLLNTLLAEGRDYPLYGVHYFLFRWIQVISNNKVLNSLFGDSSLVVHYLKWVGYEFGEIIQTGSNFGLSQKHHIPFLNYFGTRTMVSDGLNLINARQSATAFRLCGVMIGSDNFLGNNLIYPDTARIGNNCLLATKAMLPVDGQWRENTGLLGSPAFEIPRASGDDRNFDPFADDGIRKQALPRKNRSNVLSMLLLLASGFLGMFATLLLIYTAAAFHPDWGVWGWLSATVMLTAAGIGYAALLEWAMLGFRRMQPATMSIYDERYWQVERYWKFNASAVNQLFTGTPFRTLILRLMGVRVGKKLFDDGVGISEKTLVSVGDYCTFNAHSTLQSHSLEQGRFKSDAIRIGSYCTLGANAFVHYGVCLADHARIGTDAFVMKGEQVATGEFWNGNPARVMSESWGVMK